MNGKLKAPTYLIADDQPQEIVRRLDRIEEFVKGFGVPEDVLGKFVTAIEAEESASEKGVWSVQFADGFMDATFEWGELVIHATTNDNAVLGLANDLAPVVVSLDIDWRGNARRGIELGEALLESDDLPDQMVIILKTTVEGEAAAAFLREKRSPLPIRNAFFSEIGRYNIQQVEVTHEESLGNARESFELERVRYAFLALTESLLFRRSFHHGSYAEFRDDLDYFATNLEYYHCFDGQGSRKYRRQLSTAYGYSSGFPVPTDSTESKETETGLDTGYVYSVLGDSSVSGLRKKLHKLSNKVNLPEPKSIVRFFLRYPRAHQIEALISCPAMLIEGELEAKDKSVVTGKLNFAKSQWSSFGNETDSISRPQLLNALSSLHDLFKDTEGMKDEIGDQLALLKGEAKNSSDSLQPLESFVPDLKTLVGRSLPFYQADHIYGEIQHLESILNPRDGLLFYERSFGPEKKKNISFEEKVISIEHWQQILHPHAYARKRMADYSATADNKLSQLIEVLCLDCQNPDAAVAVANLDQVDFETFVDLASKKMIKTGLPASKEYQGEGAQANELTVSLLNQFAISILMEEWRIQTFLLWFNNYFLDDAKNPIRERMTEVLEALWLERGWDKLFRIEPEPVWDFVPCKAHWDPGNSLAQKLLSADRRLGDDIQYIITTATKDLPAWLVRGWTPPLNVSWLEEMGLLRKGVADAPGKGDVDGVVTDDPGVKMDEDYFASLAEYFSKIGAARTRETLLNLNWADAPLDKKLREQIIEQLLEYLKNGDHEMVEVTLLWIDKSAPELLSKI